MASSAACVLIYERASASIQTLWQAAVLLLHRSRVERYACVCGCVRGCVCSACVSAFLRMWLHTTAQCVFPQTCENSVSVCGGYPPSTVKAAASNHIRECVGDRMTRPGTSQRLPAATHIHTHTQSCLDIYHTRPSSSMSLTLSLPLFLLKSSI